MPAAAVVSHFDATIPVRRLGASQTFRGRVHPTWANPDKGAFGGAGVMYLLKASMQTAAAKGYPTPISFSAEFPGAPKENEEFDVHVKIIKAGRSFLFLRAELTETPEMAAAKGKEPTIHLFAQGMFASHARQVDMFPPRALPFLSVAPDLKSDDLIPILPLLGMQGHIKHFEAHAELKVSRRKFNALAVQMRQVHDEFLASGDQDALVRASWGLEVPEIWIAHTPDPKLNGRRRRVDEISMAYYSDIFMTLAQSPLLPMDLALSIPKLHRLASNPAFAHLREIIEGLTPPDISKVAPMNPTGEDGEGRSSGGQRRPGMRGMADVGKNKYVRPSTSSLNMHWLPLPPQSNSLAAGQDEFAQSAIVCRVQTTAQSRDVSEREVQMFLADGKGEYKLVCVARQILVGSHGAFPLARLTIGCVVRGDHSFGGF